MGRRLGWVVVAGVVAAALVAVGVGYVASDGCATAGSSSAGQPALDVALKKFRSRMADRYALLVVRNRGESTVTISRLRLEAPGLGGLPAAATDTVVDPGQRVDIPLRYGPTRCGEAGEPVGHGATVRVRVQTGKDGGAARDVRFALAEPEPLVRRIVTYDCQREALARAAEVRLGPDLRPVGPGTWRGEVLVSRRDSSAPVTIDSVDSSVLWILSPARKTSGPLARMDAGEDEATGLLTVRLPSCDPHLLTEVKTGFVFLMRARVGDGPELVTTLTVEDLVRDRLLMLIRATCGSEP
ncbi:MAG: hypothetical protein ACRDYU_04510 [Actinomycetes bacterium]